MRKDQRGVVDFMFVAVLVVLVAAAAFTLWQVNKADETVSETEASTSGQLVPVSQVEEEATSEDNDSNKEGLQAYKNDELGFSFSYPDTWGEVSENRQDLRSTDFPENEDGIYLTLYFSSYDNYENIKFYAATNDWYVSKGPFPASLFLSRGFTEQDGKFFTVFNGETSETELTGATYDEQLEALYWVEPAVFGLNEVSYNYAFNTKAGGLLLSSLHENDVDTMKQIAETFVAE